MTATIQFGPYRLTPAERRLERDGRPVVLGSRALDVLIALVERAGEVVPRRELMDRVWPDLTVEDANLRVHVAALRKALGEGANGARYIANIPGRGYCFVAPIDSRQAEAKSAPIREPRARSPLPPRLSRMVGRDQTVAVLADLVRERRHVSIVGPGGMGKTTVAVAVAHDLAEVFEGRVAFVDLATLAHPGLVTASVSAALGAQLTEPDPLLGLLAFVANRRMLIVLDNCEHLAGAVAALAEQLYVCAPELHLLATSREALRTEGEQVYGLEPLESPPDLAAEAAELLKYPAVQLFMERAAASGYRKPLDDVTAPLVAGMCHRLDGIALAIELVASRLGTYGVHGTAELLDNRFKLLWQGRRSALPRHQTLHAMLDWSFSLLSECDRSVLARLSVFAGQFDLEAVQAVVLGDGCDAFDVDQSLDNLVEKSLVWTCASAASSPLYRLPHVTRDFALVELAKRDEKRAVEARHARHVLDRLKAAGRQDGSVSEPGLAVLTVLVPSLRAALNWSFSDQGDRELAIDLAVAAAPAWLGMGRLGECRHWSERALGVLPDRDKGGAKECALQEALAASAMFTRSNDHTVAAAIERGVALAEALGEPRRLIHLLMGKHTFLSRIGAFGEATEVALRNLEIATRLGAPSALALSEWRVGISYHLVGRQKDAQFHFDRGFALEAVGAVDVNIFGYDHRVSALSMLARCIWLQGRWDHGVVLGAKALQEAARGGGQNLCIALVNAATVLLWMRAFDEAEVLIDRVEKHAGRHALAPYQAAALALRGELMCGLGEHEEAVEPLRGALRHLHEENYQLVSSRALRALAESLMYVGRLDEARVVIDDAIDSLGRSGGHFELCELLRTQGEIRRRGGDEAGAEAALLAAVALADKQGAVSWRLRSGEALARLWLSRGCVERARAEASTLLALLEHCDSGELLVATRGRLLALREALQPACALG